MKNDKLWKKKLPLETMVFATIDFSKTSSSIQKYINDAFDLKNFHNQSCGLLLSRKVSWSKKMIDKIEKELNQIDDLIYFIEKVEEDPTTLLLYI